MTSYRFGFDVGTNSLGWCVLELDSKGVPCAIENAGVRIFTDGRNDKTKTTLKASRREARSARRRRDRFKQRQHFLLAEMIKSGLFPESESERKALQKLDPLQLRHEALHEKLEPHRIGRALFHLNQRRGFRSNRKSQSDQSEKGKVADSVRKLLEQMHLVDQELSKEEYKNLKKEEQKLAREEKVRQKKQAFEKLSADRTISFGSFLWQRRKNNEPTRARPNADSKLYDLYPTREMLEDEFDKIWEKQSGYHSNLLTESLKDRLHSVIFTQRKLKAPAIGRCAYITSEYRAYRALPTIQRYRIYQEVNNLSWLDYQGTHQLTDHREARDEIINLLEKPTAKKVPFSKMKNILKKHGLAEGSFNFNLERSNRNHLVGNYTSFKMSNEDCVGKEWYNWTPEKQDGFVDLILNDSLEDEEVLSQLTQDYGLSETAADFSMNAQLDEGTASISLRTARLLIEKMKNKSLIQPHAIKEVAQENDCFTDPYTKARECELLPELPYYGKAFENSHIIPGMRNLEDKKDNLKFFGGVSNPTVHIALNQIRHVVNELIGRYGHPRSIAIELARNLPAGKKKRGEIEEQNKKNQEKNEELDKILEQHGKKRNHENRLRFRLWEELDKDPNGRLCPFTGRKIGIADLFDGSTEIEHLLPISKTLDDSRANKVICSRKANRDKDNQTPFEAFGGNPNGYNWGEILERARRLPESKQWRFQKNAFDIWKRDHDDFLARHLNDTRYIGRMAREYLENICPNGKIDVLTGRLTAMLRINWGLESVLQCADKLPKEQREKKNRDDHRHHAIDAIVVGMTTRSVLQKVATAAAQAEKMDLCTIFPKDSTGRSPIDPWSEFQRHVINVIRKIVVSHKRKVKSRNGGATTGQLHNDGAYGIASNADNTGLQKVVVRRPIKKFKTEKHIQAIRDPVLREDFATAFSAGGVEGIISLAKERGIRSLRCTKNLTVIPIKDRVGNPYKAVAGHSNWGVEIYEYPKGHKQEGKWISEVISTFEANSKGFQPGQTKKPHPAARLVMRLQINDCVTIKNNDITEILRLQKASSNELTWAPHHEANVDKRNKDSEDSFHYFRKSINWLKELNGQKVHISPAGRISYEKRRKPRRHY